MTRVLELDDFSPAVGEPFAVRAEGAPALELRLVEARALGEEPFRDRVPFALLFRGPSDPVLPQATYALTHARLGEQAIFIVPVGRTADGADYEAIFT